ncbi:MAG: TlyA family RNA methyltransferase [Myxococcota bacterium]|nr:TlyA family RNA methyltransferase [Myxococcota bacterium]
MSPQRRRRMRLDQALLERGLSDTIEHARALIMSGVVLVDDAPDRKAGELISVDARLRLRGAPGRYVSRGGLKLEQALQTFGVEVKDKVAIDVGASTGGFTDCLLQHGARLVYAVDVGYGQLAHKLRIDPRVRVMERFNIRALEPEHLEEAPQLAVADVSFISLEKAIAPLRAVLSNPAQLLLLIKPQFEAERAAVEGGVLRDPVARQAAIDNSLQALTKLGFVFRSGIDCATHGPKGNVEYLAWLDWKNTD